MPSVYTLFNIYKLKNSRVGEIIVYIVMGNLLVLSFERISSVVSSPYHIVMVGLDNAGKTSILYRAKLRENIKTYPTTAFNVECVSVTKKLKFKVWDVGGRESNRPLWRAYVRQTEGVVFVVDSVDQSRMEEAKHELFNLVHSDSAQLKEVPILVVANKQDSIGALSPEMIAKELKLNELSGNHMWHVEGSSCYVGDGFNEGLKTLAKMIAECKGENPKERSRSRHAEKTPKASTRNKRKGKRRNSTSSHEGILV